MARVSVFIDGFNLFHALDNVKHQHFKWINLRKLAELYLRKQDCLSDIFYFTAFAIWNAEKVNRHKLYIKAQESFGVKPIYGEFRSVIKRCRYCGKTYNTYEEKETDVNIAIKLYQQAKNDTYDNAIILSGDSDQIPAITAVKKDYPAKRIGVLIPPGRKAKLLKQEADFHFKIEHKHLSDSLLPNDITLPNGSQIYCPERWKKPLVVSDQLMVKLAEK